MLAEARGFALLTRRVRKDHQELRHLRRPSRHLVRDKAEGKDQLDATRSYMESIQALDDTSHPRAPDGLSDAPKLAGACGP